MVRPPSRAAATLSGWPSIAAASSRICSRSNGRPTRVLAPRRPATMAVELEPRPDDRGTRMSQWMRRPAGAALPASSHKRRNARATRLLPSRGSPAGPGPSTVTTIAVTLEREADLVPQVERQPEAVEARARCWRWWPVPSPGRWRRVRLGSRLALEAHASSPYSAVSGPPPRCRGGAATSPPPTRRTPRSPRRRRSPR